MALVRVEVTAEDIARGKPHDCCACPVALAVRRATGRTAWVGESAAPVWVDDETSVYPCAISLGDPVTGRIDYINDEELKAPDDVDAFYKAFDAGKDVAPFAFDLDVPEAP